MDSTARSPSSPTHSATADNDNLNRATHVSASSQIRRHLLPRRAKEVPEVTIASEIGSGGLQGEESDLTPIEDEDVRSQKKVGTRRKKTKRRSYTANEEEGDFQPSSSKGKMAKRAANLKKRKVSALVEDDYTHGEDEGPRKKRRRVARPEPVYVIPDVERKETTFRGRLGYACLNTILRNKRPASEAIFCSRTCRIESIKKNGIEWVKDLGRQNVEDVLQIIEWNEQNNIRFMRLSSEMFPFASHDIYGYSLDYCAPLLAKVGALARKYGHRLTTHPGQFTQLGSPHQAVVRASIRDLQYHCEMLDLMGVGADGVMIIHGGGTYGNKEAALARIKKTIKDDLPEHVRGRLVLENDELCYNAADLLPLCNELDIPLVFDYHHDMLNPSPGLPPSAIIEEADRIFRRRGIRPKQHYSEPRDGAVTVMERRAHSDRCQNLPNGLPDDMDLMIEAKDKEQAVLHLHRVYGLQPVIDASLRPPADKESKETKGRKSTRKARLPTENKEDAATHTGSQDDGFKT